MPRHECPDYILISAIVNLAGSPYLYVGRLDAYFLAQDGQLDRLVLTDVMRRPLEDEKFGEEGDDPRLFPIEGDSFVLRYSETTTLNIEYVKLAAAVDGSGFDNENAELGLSLG